MADIVVTTPKRHRALAEQEARDVIAAGGGYYFRKLAGHVRHVCSPGDRCFFVEDGAVRGYCVIDEVTTKPEMVCATSGREFGPGLYVIMDATTWTWVEPILMRGFQGWRYRSFPESEIIPLGGWLEPRPGA